MNGFDIFICCANNDCQPVKQLVRKLKRDGFRVWFDIEQTGSEALDSGKIANSAHMLVCLSNAHLMNCSGVIPPHTDSWCCL